MPLIATITGTTPVNATLVVSANKAADGSVAASGSTSITINPAKAASAPSTGSGQTGTTYVPSGHTTNLYGSPDLAVTILSINSLSSIQGRVSVQFAVTNVGTNVAPAGWNLSANLPVGYSYLYTSPAQQALYPGDKIVYTLGFTGASYQNQYCTQQYPNANCPWYQAPYQPYPYQGTCYRYDGYQNTPVPCTDGSGNQIYTSANYPYNQNYNYTYGSGYNGNLVTITADASNRIYESNEYNNTASIASPIY